MQESQQHSHRTKDQTSVQWQWSGLRNNKQATTDRVHKLNKEKEGTSHLRYIWGRKGTMTYHWWKHACWSYGMVKNRAHKVFWETKAKQKRKFDGLMRWWTSPLRLHQHQGEKRAKVVVNLSKRELSENEVQILSLDMNFAITPKQIPTDEVIAGTVSLAKYLCLEIAMEQRRLVKSCLMDIKTP